MAEKKGSTARQSTLTAGQRRSRSNGHTMATHARHIGALGNGISADEWMALICCPVNICTYCGQRFDVLTMDHIDPLSRGGAHDADNLTPSCALCNGRKGRKALLVWLAEEAAVRRMVRDGRDATEKYCRGCWTAKPHSAFSRGNGVDGLHCRCRACGSAREQAHRARELAECAAARLRRAVLP